MKFKLKSYLLVALMLTASALPGFAQMGKVAPKQPPSSPFPRIAYDEQAWKEFESTEGGFIIAFPGKPGFMTQTGQALAGPVANHIHGLDIGVAVFMVSYTDIPSLVPADDKELINHGLDVGRDRALSGTNSRLISEEPLTLDGYIGRGLFYSSDDGSLTHSRSYIVGNRLYQVVVVSDDYRKSPKEDKVFFKGLVNRFFASFKLTRKSY